MTLPLHIFEPRYKLMVKECIDDSHPFGVVLIRSGSEVGSDAAIYEVGTTAFITHVEQLEEGRYNIGTLGCNRFRVVSVHQNKPYLSGIVEDFPLEDTENPAVSALMKKVGPLLRAYLNIFATLGNVELEIDALPKDPVTLAFLTAIILRTPMPDKQTLLNIPNLITLLNVEKKLLWREAEILKYLIDNGPRWRDLSEPFSAN
jgi:Lon protease-like protein